MQSWSTRMLGWSCRHTQCWDRREHTDHTTSTPYHTPHSPPHTPLHTPHSHPHCLPTPSHPHCFTLPVTPTLLYPPCHTHTALPSLSHQHCKHLTLTSTLQAPHPHINTASTSPSPAVHWTASRLLHRCPKGVAQRSRCSTQLPWQLLDPTLR